MVFIYVQNLGWLGIVLHKEDRKYTRAIITILSVQCISDLATLLKMRVDESFQSQNQHLVYLIRF